MKNWLALLVFSFSLKVNAKLTMVTTTTDMKAIVVEVAGDLVDVSSIAKGTQDPHYIEAKPSFMRKLSQSDLVIAQGLELEDAWLIPLLQGARNPKVMKGAVGFLDVGKMIEPLEIPKANATRADGDVHPDGNPHFQLDPIRMGGAAVFVANKLGELDPVHKTTYHERAITFQKLMDTKTQEWMDRIKKSGVHEVVTYHKTFTYFLSRFGIKSILQLEPKPGVPPTASHLLDVFNQMRDRKIKVVLIENYFDSSIENKIKESVPNALVHSVAVSVGGEENIISYTQLIENLVKLLEMAK